MSIELSRKRTPALAAQSRSLSPRSHRSSRRGGGGGGAPARGLGAAARRLAAALVPPLPPRRRADERQVDGAAAAVARLLGDVAVLEEPVLADARIELGLHAGVVEVLGPR